MSIFDLNIAPPGYETGAYKNENYSSAGVAASASKENSGQQPRAYSNAYSNACPAWLREFPKATREDYSRSRARTMESRSTVKPSSGERMISISRLREMIAEVQAHRKRDL